MKDPDISDVDAAYYLNVSSTFVSKEMEAGRLPHRQVGSQRRIAREDFLAYAQNLRAQREGALDRLADNARELGLDC